MIYARLLLNARSRQVLRDIANPYELHRSLMSAFPDGSTREKVSMLYRLEGDLAHSNGVLPVLVQSAVPADWTSLTQRSQYLLQIPVEQKQVELPSTLQGTFRFKLCANPTLRKSDSRKRVPLQSPQHLIEWMQKKGSQHGFSVDVAELIIRKVPPIEMFKTENSKRMRIQIQPVEFSGWLTVTEPQAFLSAWQNGIGPAKAFGCGLLSIARP